MRIILVSYGGGHVTMLEPLATKARAAGHEVKFLALTTAQHYLQQRGEAYLCARDLLPFAAPGAREYGEKLATNLEGHAQIPREESVAYLGISFAELVETHGEEAAQRLYETQGRQAFLPVNTLTRAFRDWQPDLVIATNSPRMERAAIEAAGKLGIPSLCLVDLFALHEIEWIKQPGFATRVCVLNEAVRQMVISHGRRPEEVVVTGNPAFDRLFEPELISQGKAMRDQRGWNDGRITLLYGSQDELPEHPFIKGLHGDVTLRATTESILRDYVAADDRYRLVIRYHPNQKITFVPGKNVEFSPVSENVAALLHAVDALVTMTSTIAVEAYIAGRPVITADCSIFTPDAPYSQMGISTGVATPQDLPAALNALADDWATRVHGESHYTITSATDVVWDVLQHMAVPA